MWVAQVFIDRRSGAEAGWPSSLRLQSGIVRRVAPHGHEALRSVRLRRVAAASKSAVASGAAARGQLLRRPANRFEDYGAVVPDGLPGARCDGYCAGAAADGLPAAVCALVASNRPVRRRGSSAEDDQAVVTNGLTGGRRYVCVASAVVSVWRRPGAAFGFFIVWPWRRWMAPRGRPRRSGFVWLWSWVRRWRRLRRRQAGSGCDVAGAASRTNGRSRLTGCRAAAVRYALVCLCGGWCCDIRIVWDVDVAAVAAVATNFPSCCFQRRQVGYGADAGGLLLGDEWAIANGRVFIRARRRGIAPSLPVLTPPSLVA